PPKFTTPEPPSVPDDQSRPPFKFRMLEVLPELPTLPLPLRVTRRLAVNVSALAMLTVVATANPPDPSNVPPSWRVNLPPLRLRVDPEAAVSAPPTLPPPWNCSVPVWTSMVPELLKPHPTVLVPVPTDLRNVAPALLTNVPLL